MAEHFRCPKCGPHVKADEDGCCAMCGIDCVGEPCGCHVCGTKLEVAEKERDTLRTFVEEIAKRPCEQRRWFKSSTCDSNPCVPCRARALPQTSTPPFPPQLTQLFERMLVVRLDLNAGDTFAYACADYVTIDETGLPLLLECFNKFQDDGVTAFLSAVRGAEVIKPWQTPKFKEAIEWLKSQNIPPEIPEED